MGQRSLQIIKNLRQGEVITHQHMNALADVSNMAARALSAPKQVASGSDDVNADAGGSTATIGNEVFDSTSGTETTVTATDSNGDTVDIERVDTITFTEQTSGRTMTLNITYPL